MYTSPDGIHWHQTVWLRENPDEIASPVSPYSTGPIILDPDGAENPWEEEIHDAVGWRENGILMTHYDAFYFHFNQRHHDHQRFRLIYYTSFRGKHRDFCLLYFCFSFSPSFH